MALNTHTFERRGLRWGDRIVDDEYERDRSFVEMDKAAWAAVTRRHLSQCREMRAALRWINMIEAKRADHAASQSVPPHQDTEDELEFRLFCDMVNEPAKYGTDIAEALELQDKLNRGPKRWRVAAFWAEKEAEDKLHLSATKIQALWRGHADRVLYEDVLDCGQCLAHRPCGFEAEGKKMCASCCGEYIAEALLKLSRSG